MTEKEMIEQLINQNNNNINCFIGIIVGSIAIIIVIFSFLEKQLSDKKIDFMIKNIESDLMKGFYQDNLKLLKLVKEEADGTTEELNGIKGEINEIMAQEINDQIIHVTERINELTQNEVYELLLSITVKLEVISDKSVRNSSVPKKYIQALDYQIRNGKFKKDNKIIFAMNKINNCFN